MAKKTNKVPQQNLSPEAYIRQRGRSLEILECYLPEDEFKEEGEGVIVVARKHTGGNITFGVYLIDTFCMGVKDTFFAFRKSENEYDDYINQLKMGQEMKKVDYEVAHNWIFGAIEFAREAGIEPHRDFAVTKYLLADDEDENIPIIEYPFGKDGKHYLISDSISYINRYKAIMEKNLGKGNFETLFMEREYGSLDEDR